MVLPKEYSDFRNELVKCLEDDNVHNILVRGYNNVDKAFVTIGTLNGYYSRKAQENNSTAKATLVVNVLGTIEQLYNNNLGMNFKNPKIGQPFNFLNIIAKFETLQRSYSGFSGSGDDFALFYSVESAMFDTKTYNHLKTKLSNSSAKKNIMVTTNDYSKLYDKDDLTELADAVLIIDTTKEHPDEYKIIRENNERDNVEMPY